MTVVSYLQPFTTPASMERLLAEVQEALAAGHYLGDRRPVLNHLVNDLRHKRTRLIDAKRELKDFEQGTDALLKQNLARCDAMCSEVVVWLDELLRKAEELSSSI